MSKFETVQMLPKIDGSGADVSWAELDAARKSTASIQIPGFSKPAAALRRAVHPLLRDIMARNRKSRGLALRVENEGALPLPDDGRPIVFVENHTNAYDMPYAAEVIHTHFYVLAALAGHTPLTRALSNINGVSYWMERGNAHIVPLVSEYTGDTCYINRGKSFEVNDFFGPISANNALRATMLTTKKSMRARYGVTEDAWDHLRKRWLAECPQIDPESEKQAILRDRTIGLPPDFFIPKCDLPP